MARQSLEHSFMAGRSLWQKPESGAAVCERDVRKPESPSPPCKALLQSSERARVQWQLEKAFADFEEKF
jgi:adenosine deaminase